MINIQRITTEKLIISRNQPKFVEILDFTNILFSLTLVKLFCDFQLYIFIMVIKKVS